MKTHKVNNTMSRNSFMCKAFDINDMLMTFESYIFTHSRKQNSENLRPIFSTFLSL